MQRKVKKRYYFTIRMYRDIFHAISNIIKQKYNISPYNYGCGLYGSMEWDYFCYSLKKKRAIIKFLKTNKQYKAKVNK